MKISTICHTFPLPFKAILPGLIGLTMLTIRSFIKNFLLSGISEEDRLIQNLTWFIERVYEAIRGIEEATFASYSDYFSFMLMMGIINLVSHGSDIKRYCLTKEPQNHSHDDQRKRLLISFLKNFLLYSLMYGFYQSMLIALFPSNISLPFLSEVAKSPFKAQEIMSTMTGRMLEERSLPNYDMAFKNSPPQKKPSLSIGKVMSEIDVVAYSVKLSKDGKTIFVAANFPSALKIIDISDSEYPVILSSLPLSEDYAQITYKALLVSPDETKIYVSNFENLEVIDISDFKSPKYLAEVKDRNLFKPEIRTRIGETCEPNLIMSKDQRFLFASGFGLQLFDVSNVTAPFLVSSVVSRENSKKLIPSSIALSQDGKTLYYSDGSIWIYNVEEDPKEKKLISSFEPRTPLFYSMVLSKDYKTAFVLSSNEESKMMMQKLDISDINLIKEGPIFPLGPVVNYPPVFLTQTANSLFLLIRYPDKDIGYWDNVLVFDIQEERVVNHEKLLIKNDVSVLFTQDYKKIFVGSREKLRIVDLYLEFPNKNAFSNSSNVLRTLNTEVVFTKTSFAPSSENILYSISRGESSFNMNFGVHNIASDEFSNISSYKTDDQVRQVVISSDNQKAFLVGSNTVQVLDLSNPEDISFIGKYQIENESFYMFGTLLISRDGQTGFLTSTWQGIKYLRILDFSDAKNPKQKSVINLGEDSSVLEIVLSKDERILFLVSRVLDVYNVSDHSSPKFLAQLTFLVDKNFMLSSPEVALSPDGKTLFVKDASTITYFAVHVVDVSNVTSPQTRSEFRFPPAKFGMNLDEEFFAVSRDSRTLYILRDWNLMTLDVSNVSSPRYLGAIRIPKRGEAGVVTAFKLGKDNRKAYLFTEKQECHIVSLQPVYTAYMKQDVLILGERYNINLEVIKMDQNMDYNRLEGNYRFTKFALVEPRSIQNPNFEDVVLKAPPSWMSFDLKSQVLTVESKRKNDIGIYRVCYGFSTRLPKNIFSNMNETEDLFANLLGLGYVDNQLFLTENFGEYEDFILPVQYLYVKKEIYQILRQYSFETFNEINVIGSLNILEDAGGKLKISTASTSNLKVEVNLECGLGKFLMRYYGSLLPTITNEKSRLILEGNLKDINLALQEVVLNSNLDCDGMISVSDKLNPMMEISVKNISRYFNHNLPPRRNNSFPLKIQEQIEKEMVYTGKYFQIKLNQQAFSDKYTLVENLNYHVFLVNGTALPTWLSFSDMTLMGTPPESLFDRNFDLELVIQNEFQELREPIRLHVRISSSFVLALLAKYSPYIVTVLGLYIKANMIYNILAKKKYKHVKDFYVKIGEEITPEVIFPVSFVAEERQEAEKLLKFLRKKFVLDGEKMIDRNKISAKITETLSELSYKEQEELGFYLDGHRPRTRVVDQIIFNTLTMEILKSNNEKETRMYYEKIKKNWPDFVDWDIANSCFKLNEEEFEKILQNQTLTSTSTDLQNRLLHKSNINMKLLKDAILCFAFDCQNIDTLPAYVQLKVKEKAKGGCLKRYLKLDLRDCPFTEKGKIGYGMTYHKDYNTLFFDGLVKPDIQRKTIVFQITSLKQKILKEIWIMGDGSLPSRNSESPSSSRGSDLKRQEYEIL